MKMKYIFTEIAGFYKSTLMVSTFINAYRILTKQKTFNSAWKTLQNGYKIIKNAIILQKKDVFY